MEQTIITVLQEYGVIGILLGYFLWKDSRTFEIFRKTMQEIVTELKMMREKQDKIIHEQYSMNEDIQQLKETIRKN